MVPPGIGASAPGDVALATDLDFGTVERIAFREAYRAALVASKVGEGDADVRRRVEGGVTRVGLNTVSVQPTLRNLGLVNGQLEPSVTVKDLLSQLRVLAGDLGDAPMDPGGVRDTRILAVQRDPVGVRRRAFTSARHDCLEANLMDWPVTGPRTAEWCLNFIGDEYGTPTNRHARFVSDGGLSTRNPDIILHNILLHAVERAICYDQLDIVNLASFEEIFRGIQLIESAHRGKFINTVTRGAYDVWDDAHIFAGHSGSRGHLLIDPRLESHIGNLLSAEWKAEDVRLKVQAARVDKTTTGENPSRKKGKDGMVRP